VNGPVDVLAVIDNQLEYTAASDYPGASDEHRDLLATRAAVAELIEADREYDAALILCGPAGICGGVRMGKAIRRRNAALANVGSAS
jgi:hypothetical protein